MKKTRWIAVLLAAMFVAESFFACSHDSDDNDDGTTEQTTAENTIGTSSTDSDTTDTSSTSNTADTSDTTNSSADNSSDTINSIAEKTLTGYQIAITLKKICTDDILKFLPSETAPSGTATKYSLNDEIGAVMWIDGDTIYYYAEGYTDSSKGIHLNESAESMFDFNYDYRDSQAHCPFVEIDMTGFDTSSSTNMQRMFNNCSSLESLNMSKFDTSKVQYMHGMFDKCSSLTTLDVRGFDTSNVTTMNEMFRACSSLTSIDLSKFDTSKVINMNDMFNDCSSLASLDLSSFDTSKVTDMDEKFYGCTSLNKIYAASNADWGSSTALSSGMFYGCSVLVGGNGTTYDSSHTDATYARVDGGTSTPGYFTAK